MDINDSGALECGCGKVFSQQNALGNHQRKCRQLKRSVSQMLDRARDVWLAKKRRKQEEKDNRVISLPNQEHHHEQPSPPGRRNIEIANAHPIGSPAGTPQADHLVPLAAPSEARDLHISIAKRKPKRINVQLPARFREDTPPPLARPVTTLAAIEHPDVSLLNTVAPEATSSAAPPVDHVQGRFGADHTQRSPSHRELAPRCGNREDAPAPNAFGLYRRYISSKSGMNVPDDEAVLYSNTSSDSHSENINDSEEPSPGDSDDPDLPSHPSHNIFWPYPNKSSFLLGEWFWGGGPQKSQRGFQELLNIITSESFSTDDISDTNWKSIDQHLGGTHPSGSLLWETRYQDVGWLKEAVSISVPFNHAMRCLKPQDFCIGYLYRRSLISILRERVTSSDGAYFHFQPHEMYWRKNGPTGAGQRSVDVRVYGEAYSSPTFIQMHEEVQHAPSKPNGCVYPRVAAALMLSSDETLLTQFGNSKLWPLYVYFGNVSKYRRSQPSSRQASHVAYFLKLPSTFKDFICALTGGRGPADNLITHCNRESLHSQLGAIFDEEFMEAYIYGVLIKCLDGLTRRFYPRIFSYSADYPEKASLSTIRPSVMCPCPQCLTPLEAAKWLGTPIDLWWRAQRRIDSSQLQDDIKSVRTLIYEKNYAVENDLEDKLLRKISIAPIENTFSVRFLPHGLNHFSIFVCDLMHEFEQGNWKSLFLHLIRILECIDENQVHVLNKRYRSTPPFGKGTIRKFRANTSEAKNLAARDWEDMLQCAILAFEALLVAKGSCGTVVLADHERCLLDVLFIYATWHGLAKLRLHTDDMLVLLDRTTTLLGDHIRYFQTEVCGYYDTRELEHEALLRLKRAQAAEKKRQKQAAAEKSSIPDARAGGRKNTGKKKLQKQVTSRVDSIKPDSKDPSTNVSSDRLRGSNLNPVSKNLKGFSLDTYKFHAMGHYIETIRRFGTTDSYSTESGELEHRTSKNRFRRTNKREYVAQMTEIERRQSRLQRIRVQLEHETPGFSEDEILRKEPQAEADGSEVSAESLDVRYSIAKSGSHSFEIAGFLRENAGDVALKHFYRDLREYLQRRARDLFTDDQDFTLYLHNDQLFSHKVLKVNYTTYDVRRSQDHIKPGAVHGNIMLLSQTRDESEHPYCYARVLGIYHVNVIFTGRGIDCTNTHRFDFLWVRWYDHSKPAASYRLDKLQFKASSTEGAFGFVDPVDVLRACHVIPVFAMGKLDCEAAQAPDQISHLANERDDWKAYYVNRFADRDMLMRFFWGMGVGHTHLRKYSEVQWESTCTSQQSSFKPTTSAFLSSSAVSCPWVPRPGTGPSDEPRNARDGAAVDWSESTLHTGMSSDSDVDSSDDEDGGENKDSDGPDEGDEDEDKDSDDSDDEDGDEDEDSEDML